MSTMKIVKDAKGNISKVFIEDVVFYYAQVQKAKPIYDQREWSNPNKFEYLVDVLVDEDTYDLIEETFPKTSLKKYSKEKFMERFKIESEEDLPYDSKKYFVAKFKQAAQKADGSPINPQLRPRAFEMVNGKAVDITIDKLIGNGSKGAILLRSSTNSTYGTFAYLSTLKVTDLVEYETSSVTDEAVSDFLGGDVEFADIPEETFEKPEQNSEDFSDDDLPFDDDDFE